MSKLAIAIATALIGLSSAALADPSCKDQAAAKSLHGAAATSFMKKCVNDAKAKCNGEAKAKALHGAAETSFVTKCVRDAGA